MAETETKKEAAELQEKLRDALCDLLAEEPFVTQLNHYKIAEVLVSSAFAWMDFNGGIGDTCHAAKQLHRLVEEAASRRHPAYSYERLRKYLKGTNEPDLFPE